MIGSAIGLPFLRNKGLKLPAASLLLAAWLHAKKPVGSVILDERPKVDRVRTAFLGRGLLFTGSEYVEFDGLQLPSNSSADSWKIEFEAVCPASFQSNIVDGRGASNNGAVLGFRPNGLLFQFNGSDLLSSITPRENQMYRGHVSYDGTTMRMNVEGLTVGEETRPRSWAAHTQNNLSLMRNWSSGGSIWGDGLVGWLRFTFNDLVVADYNFEEGDGADTYNSVGDFCHGTITGATMETFRVEDYRITNGGRGCDLNTFGYRDNGGVFVPRIKASAESMVTRYENYNDKEISISNASVTLHGSTPIEGRTNVLEIKANASSSAHFIDLSASSVVGLEHTIQGEAFIPSIQPISGSPQTCDQFYAASLMNEVPQINTQDSWESFAATGTALDTKIRARMKAANSNSFSGENDVVYLSGVLSHISGIYVPNVTGQDGDIFGNALTYSTPRAVDLELVESSCASLLNNGESIDLTTPVHLDDDFTFIWYAYLDGSSLGASSYRESFASFNSADLFYFRSTGIYFRSNDVNNAGNWVEGTIPEEDYINKWQRFSLSRNKTTRTLTFTAGNVTRTFPESEASVAHNWSVDKFGDLAQTGLRGHMAWAAIYDRVLSPAEVLALDEYKLDGNGLQLHLVPAVGGGATVYDFSGNDNHGTATGVTLSDFWGAQDNFHWNIHNDHNTFQEFDGSASGFQLGDRIALDLTTPFRLRTAFYFENKLANTHKLFQFQSDTDTSVMFTFEISNGGVVLIGFYDGGVAQEHLISTPLADGWYYVVADYDGAGNWAGTLNGSDLSTTASANYSYSGFNAAIGYQAGHGSPASRFKGLISFVEIVGIHNWPAWNLFRDTVGNLGTDIEPRGGTLRLPFSMAGEPLINKAGKHHNAAETKVRAPVVGSVVAVNDAHTISPFLFHEEVIFEADFSSSASGFIGTNATVTHGNTVSDGTTSHDNVLTLEAVNGGAGTQHFASQGLVDVGMFKGTTQRLDVEILFYVPSGQLGVDGLRCYTGFTDDGFPTNNTTGQWTQATFPLEMIGRSSGAIRLQMVDGSDITPDLDVSTDLLHIASFRIVQRYSVRSLPFRDLFPDWKNYEDQNRLMADTTQAAQLKKVLATSEALSGADLAAAQKHTGQ